MESDRTAPRNSGDGIYVKKTSFYALIAGTIVAVGVAAFFVGSYSSALNTDQVTQEDLEKAMSSLELRVLQSQLPSNQPNRPVSISIDDDPVRGSIDAPITIIEFSDFQCPFCARFHMETLPLLLENYIDTGMVKLVYRDFPIQNIHPNAMPAAVAAGCANEQGKFWQYHDMLFENQDKWNKLETAEVVLAFEQYASEMGLDQKQFDMCLRNGKYIDEIRNDLDDGREYGVTGTPGFFVGNDSLGFVELKGAKPFESFQSIIDSQISTMK